MTLKHSLIEKMDSNEMNDIFKLACNILKSPSFFKFYGEEEKKTLQRMKTCSYLEFLHRCMSNHQEKHWHNMCDIPNCPLEGYKID